MHKVIIPLVLVLTITIGLSSQEAYAVPSCASVDAGLLNNEVYIGDSDGVLWKVDTTDASSCSLGEMQKPSGKVVKCFDVALHPTTGVLYCITPGDLWTIDQDDGPGGPAGATNVGPLAISGGGGTEVNDANGMETNAAGQFYVVGDDGAFYTMDETTGVVTEKNADLGPSSSGDLAWNPVTGKMFWTADSCPGNSCPGRDGLWEIDLTTYMATFKWDLQESNCVGGGCVNDGFNRVFAMDFLPYNGNLCMGTRGGELFQWDPIAGVQVGMTKTGPNANGGTALNAVAGGIPVLSDETSSILEVVFSNQIWMTLSLFAGVGLVSFKLRREF